MKKLLYLVLVFGLFACSSDSADEDSNNSNPCPNQPQLITYEVSNIDYDENTDLSSATFTAEIQNIQLGPDCETFSITNQGFVYGTNIQPTTSDNVVNGNGQNATANVTGLPTETTYYVRSYLTNVLGTFYGNEVSFTTPQSTVPVYLDDNGVTVKARDWAEIGMSGVINGETYFIVDREGLREIMFNYYSDNNQTHPNNAVTTFITDLSNDYTNGECFFRPVYNFDVSSWDVSNVTTMRSLFSRINIYEGGYDMCDDGEWTDGVLSVFNQDLSYWDVGNVTTMRGMFAFSSFNQPIGNWDTSNVTDMTGVFQNNDVFNQPLNNWDVGNVTDMTGMFLSSPFNQPLNEWNMSNVSNMSLMFGSSPFNQDISSWDVSNVVNMTATFGDSDFNQPLNDWNVSNVSSMGQMFQNNDVFNQPLNNWDVSSSTIMQYMFLYADLFNQDLSSWDVSNVNECVSFCLGATNWTLPKPNFTNCSDYLGCN